MYKGLFIPLLAHHHNPVDDFFSTIIPVVTVTPNPLPATSAPTKQALTMTSTKLTTTIKTTPTDAEVFTTPKPMTPFNCCTTISAKPMPDGGTDIEDFSENGPMSVNIEIKNIFAFGGDMKNKYNVSTVEKKH